MTPSYKPRTVQELADYVAIGAKLEIVGSGTKRGLGRPLQAETALDMSGFTGISLYEPEELVLEAGAGTRLSDIEKALGRTQPATGFRAAGLFEIAGRETQWHAGRLDGLRAFGTAPHQGGGGA